MQTAKIGKYVETFMLVQSLKKRRNRPEEDQELLDTLFVLSERLDQEQYRSIEPFLWKNLQMDDVGFYPFSNICMLSKDFRILYEQLRAGPENQSDPHVWRRGIFQSLHRVVGKFNHWYQEEVARNIVFVTDPEDEEYLRYYKDNGWQVDPDQKDCFGWIPRLAQTCFQDSAQCIVFDLRRPALSLALQGFESTLRYFYKRLKSDDQPCWSKRSDWGDMIKELSQGNFITQNTTKDLGKLQDARNTLSHGRAMQKEVSREEVTEIFHNCWKSCQNLFYDVRTNPKSEIRLIVHQELTFDVAVATFLFHSNSELPAVSFSNPDAFHRIVFDTENIEKDQLVDLNVHRTFSRSNEKSLSQKVMEYIEPQRKFPEQIQNLVNFTAEKKEDKSTYDIADLFNDICQDITDPANVLDKSWRIFFELSQRKSLNPKDGKKLKMYL